LTERKEQLASTSIDLIETKQESKDLREAQEKTLKKLVQE